MKQMQQKSSKQCSMLKPKGINLDHCNWSAVILLQEFALITHKNTEYYCFAVCVVVFGQATRLQSGIFCHL